MWSINIYGVNFWSIFSKKKVVTDNLLGNNGKNIAIPMHKKTLHFYQVSGNSWEVNAVPSTTTIHFFSIA